MESILQQVEKAAQVLASAHRELETVKEMVLGLPELVAKVEALAEQKASLDAEMREVKTSVLIGTLSIARAMGVTWISYEHSEVKLRPDGALDVPILRTGRRRIATIESVVANDKFWRYVCSGFLANSNYKVGHLDPGIKDEEKYFAEVRKLVEQIARSIPAEAGQT